MDEQDLIKFKKFQERMIFEIDGHQYIYGDTWKNLLNEQQMDKRIENKFEEYKLTKNPKKLLSLSNLAMFQYINKGGDLE